MDQDATEQAGAPAIGRPSEYRPEFVRIAAKACKMGATDADLADFFGVHIRTVQHWAGKHEPFRRAITSGKKWLDENVQRSLYHRAVGYTFDAVKLFQHEGKVIRAEYREHVPPDTAAAFIWLKNRRPDQWRDKREVNVTVDVNTRVDLSGMAKVIEAEIVQDQAVSSDPLALTADDKSG